MTGDKQKEIADRLAEIHRRNGGRLTTDAVIEDARDPRSPLHDQFTWDVDKAAYEHWQQQARELITSVRYVVETETKIVRIPVYHRDPRCAATEPGYIDTPRLSSDEDLARAALVDAFRSAGDMLRRARELALVLGMEEDVDRLIRGVYDLRSQIQQDTASLGPSGPGVVRSGRLGME